MTRFPRPVLALLLAAAACGDTSAPAAPPSRDAALRRFDDAITALNWAQHDLFALGGRDIVVFVQLDSNLAPHYFRLPRGPR